MVDARVVRSGVATQKSISEFAKARATVVFVVRLALAIRLAHPERCEALVQDQVERAGKALSAGILVLICK